MNEKIVLGTMTHGVSQYYSAQIRWLIEQRKSAAESFQKESINLQIILNSAFYFEGCLGEGLNRLCMLIPKDRVNTDSIYNRIAKDFKKELQRCTGLENYSEFFKVLAEKNIPTLINDNNCWEGLRALFNLRNSLAHAKSFSVKIYENHESDAQDILQNGFANSCNYFLKNNLITKKTSDSAFYLQDILIDEVANWSVKLAKAALLNISNGLAKHESEHFNLAGQFSKQLNFAEL